MKFSTVCAFVVVVVLAVVVMLIIWSNNNSLLSLQCMKRLKHSQDNAKKTPATPPANCVILGHACDCPVSSWAAASVSRETACAMLQDRTVFFAGDSLSRDLWSSAGAWLLDEEIRTMKHAGHLNHNQACMLCAWKFAPDVWDELRSRRLLTEVLTVHKSVSTIHACKRGRTKLVFKYARLFSDVQSIAEEISAAPGPASSKVLVVTAGMLQMSEVHAISRVQNWALQLERLASQWTTVFIGTHHRIAELTPTAFRSDADGLQGNARIRLWTSAVKKVGKVLKVIDPYNLTSELDAGYRDTEDGLHFGQWINLQKFQSLLLEINGTH
jgi:hypothetical protein